MKHKYNLTRAEADYLKALFTLGEEGQPVRTKELAAALDVSPASATGMVQKLATADPALLDYEKHHGAELTEAGRRAALKTIRQHRLVEMFLHKTLGFAWDTVHAEAERLEHVISDELEDRIATSLGDPTHDPHGAPIPTRDLEMPSFSRLALEHVQAGQRVVVERVNDRDPALLRHLSDIGIRPGVELAVEAVSPFDGNLTLRPASADEAIVLGPAVTGQVFIQHPS